MWTLILVFFGVVAVAAGAYIVFRIHRFSFIRRLAEKNKVLAWILSALPVAALAPFLLVNAYALVVALLHFFLGFVMCDLVAFIVRKVSKRSFDHDVQNVVAIVLTVVYLGAGWFFAHHVFSTEYTFYTEKEIGADIRIVEIADLHLGITLDGEGFRQQTERVQATNPDAVFIVGDFVDDDTEKDDMLAACQALGSLKTKYGVYFVYGNHDEGYFTYRNFSSEDLRGALDENGVTVLEDENVLLDDRFYVIGRLDRSMPGRKEAKDLTAGLDDSKYVIILDHQPNDYAAEQEAGADLVLSGHTHGGHIFPSGLVGLAIGANDKVYGSEVRGNTTFVVTSGISGWAIPFKTGCISEFVVIDIKSK